MIRLVIRSLVPIFFSSASLKAQQKATIQLVDRTLTTYPFSDPDPVARPDQALKYVELYQNRDEDYLDPASTKLTELVIQRTLNYKMITQTILTDVDESVDYFKVFLEILN